MRYFAILAILIFFSFTADAQQTFSISGTVKNAKGEPLNAATIFIASSQKSTSTNATGAFTIANLSPGTYQLVMSNVGYASLKRDIIIRDKSVVLDTVLQERSVVLDEVVIGDNNQKKGFIKTFTKYFLGESENGKACKILNPEKLEFSTNKKLLKAYSQDFLTIENANLGYRLKYMLRNFQYDSSIDATFYDGESVFEDMEGTPAQKQVWTANRKKAYQGSLMHYLRALHSNTTREEGFLTYTIRNILLPLVIAPNPVFTEQLIARTDSNFLKFNYKKRLYTLYDKKKASADDKPSNRTEIIIDVAPTGSILMLDADIDKRGSYSAYQSILIQGFWGTKRIGDQLPFEYLPN
ncbi:MAG: carboxypeptidase-like regulatory domain-containing protein [Bacteroidota bacterium]